MQQAQQFSPLPTETHTHTHNVKSEYKVKAKTCLFSLKTIHEINSNITKDVLIFSATTMTSQNL